MGVFFASGKLLRKKNILTLPQRTCWKLVELPIFRSHFFFYISSARLAGASFGGRGAHHHEGWWRQGAEAMPKRLEGKKKHWRLAVCFGPNAFLDIHIYLKL